MKHIIVFRSFAMAPRKRSFALIVGLYFCPRWFVVFVSPVFARCRPFMLHGYVVKELPAER